MKCHQLSQVSTNCNRNKCLGQVPNCKSQSPTYCARLVCRYPLSTKLWHPSVSLLPSNYHREGCYFGFCPPVFILHMSPSSREWLTWQYSNKPTLLCQNHPIEAPLKDLPTTILHPTLATHSLTRGEPTPHTSKTQSRNVLLQTTPFFSHTTSPNRFTWCLHISHNGSVVMSLCFSPSISPGHSIPTTIVSYCYPFTILWIIIDFLA